MKQATPYANLEIRIRQAQARGYPIELTLDGVQQFQGGHLSPDPLPWIPSADPLRDGERLFIWFFADARLREQWAAIRSRHPRRRLHLRISPNAPELHTIPWELLRDPAPGRTSETLAAEASTPFSRYIAAEWPPPDPLTARPLRLLVALANPENLVAYNLPEIDIEREKEIIQAALSVFGADELELTFLAGIVTLSALEEALKTDTHLLHLVAHGQFSRRRQMAALFLADEHNRVARVTETVLAEMLQRQTYRPHLIFLASCQSAARSPADAFRGLAPRLIMAQVPAVLAMQDVIPVETAQAFTRIFYRQLLAHGQVDLAGNEARAALLTANLPGSSSPALFSRLSDNQLLVPSLSLHEQAYRERLKARYAEIATYFIEVISKTVVALSPGWPTLDKLNTADLARFLRQRDLAEYHQWIPVGQELKREKLKTLREGVDKYACIILLGDPGSGKTTALENLAYQLAGEQDQLPLPLRLSEFGPDMTLQEFIVEGWGGATHWAAPELAANLIDYLERGRLLFLFDALNEMPRQGYQGRVRELRRFIDQWSPKGNRFLVTCRVLDYGEELSDLQRVEVQPFNDEQIQALLEKLLPQQWAVLWQMLTAGQDEERRWLKMARNPYMLNMMIYIFLVEGKLGQSRAELMRSFVRILLGWAEHRCPPERWLEAEVQQEVLSALAFEMQKRAGSGAVVKTSVVKTVMPAQVQLDPNWPPRPTPPDRVLSLAAAANIVELPVDRASVRFYHQLLQEYFAARELLKRTASDLPGLADPESLDPELAELWRWPRLEEEMPPVGPRRDWDPLPPPPQTGWEETTILAASLAPENDDQLVRALIAVNPVLAGRCLHKGRARVDPATRQVLIDALLAIVARPEVALRVRIAAGEVLGHLGDPRRGEMVTVPAGEFLMGEGNEQHKLFLPDYRLGKYPLTNAEYGRFVEAGGYQDKRWWTEAGWAEKEKPFDQDQPWTEPRYWQDGRFNKPNQPVVGVSWYECVAYCRWLSAETGQTYRLPSEAEWEKGARGVEGGQYPWGNRFEASRLNAREGEQVVNATTPVGVYPTGVSPFGAYDCAGNVWEWTISLWGEDIIEPKFKYPYNPEDGREDLTASADVRRVLRGGSWHGGQYLARCAARYRNYPNDWYDFRGYRVARHETAR